MLRPGSRPTTGPTEGGTAGREAARNEASFSDWQSARVAIRVKTDGLSRLTSTPEARRDGAPTGSRGCRRGRTAREGWSLGMRQGSQAASRAAIVGRPSRGARRGFTAARPGATRREAPVGGRLRSGKAHEALRRRGRSSGRLQSGKTGEKLNRRGRSGGRRRSGKSCEELSRGGRPGFTAARPEARRRAATEVVGCTTGRRCRGECRDPSAGAKDRSQQPRLQGTAS